jgi:hypothetical protein
MSAIQDAITWAFAHRNKREDNVYLKTIRDLHERINLVSHVVCKGCGCAAGTKRREDHKANELYCEDCYWADYEFSFNPPARAAACVSVGMRKLAGRRIL